MLRTGYSLVFAVLALPLTGATLRSSAPLRASCDPEDPVVLQLPAGLAVVIRSSISGSGGACFKIVGEHAGKSFSGYVATNAVGDDRSFDEARRAARDIGGGASATSAGSTLATQAAQAPLLGKREHPANKAWALINENQPAEALRLIEKDLQRYPMDPYLQAVAGMAYYRMDQMDQAILHWKEAEAIQPDPTVTALLRKVERERAADSGSERTVGARVVLRYERGTVNGPLAQAMVQVLDEEYSRVSATLGCRASEKVTAIAQSRQTYFQSTQAAEWSGGLYDGRIHVPISDSKVVDPRLRQVFAHELTHACLHELGTWPSWLQEGLAQRMSGEQLPAGARTQLADAIKAGKIPALRQLGQNWSGMSAQNASLAYAIALVAVEKLAELYSNTGLGNVLRNPADFPQVEREVGKAMGLQAGS